MPDITLDIVFPNPNFPVAPEPGFLDTFDRADGPVGRTSEGKRLWVPESLPGFTSHWPLLIASGKARRGAGDAATMGTRTAWTVDAEDANGTLHARIGALGDATGALLLRYVDINNYVQIGWRQSDANRNYQFVKRVGGVLSNVATSGTIASASGDSMAVTADGQTVSVAVNGSTIFGGPRTIPEHVSATRHGVLLQSSSSGVESWEEVGFIATT